MTDQKRQYVADIMDSEEASDAELEELIRDPEMRSIWSRFHLVRDLIQGEVPEAIDPQLDKRIFSAIQSEPTLLVPAARRKSNTWQSNVRTWAEQATGLAIAASVTAIMVFGVQTLNRPELPSLDNSAITSLELLNVDSSLIADKIEYTNIQEILLEQTRTDSLYGLQYMSPYVSVVKYSIPVKLNPTSDSFYFDLNKKAKVTELQKKESNSDKQ